MCASQFLPLYEDYARGGGLPSERDGDTCRKLENIKRRPIWAWLRLYLAPKGDHAKTDNQIRAMVIEIALKMFTSNAVFYY